ncbi:Integrase core domain [Anaerococcus octavius]|uniref:Integrase core domain n=1 Tax=Anaerococcus octavius TaxID=54007 RepID=A0A380WW74_9FIRM|nr:DDE-type integrase/transposase/recombinase [Anaerococcus octavius]SUU93341.1 Integrase core domain [Anaerococcus octavius]
MKQEGLLFTKFKTRSRKYSSYKGRIGKVAPSLVNRNFKVKRPKQIWLTDVTEFKIKEYEQRLYLSPILDVYNSEIISYTISHHPTIKLTNTMLKKDNCLDNSPMENFFGILKQEMYYGVKFKNYEYLRKEIEIYIKVQRRQDKDKIKRNVTC